MKYALAIDCGTTSTRVIAFDKMGSTIAMHQESLAILTPKPQWVEQRPDDIWLKTNHCLTKVINQVGAKNIVNIGITNQRETSIIWNRKTGSAMGPAISWQCRRTTSRCLELQSLKNIIRLKTGLPIDPYFSGSKFEWLLLNLSKQFPQVKLDELCFGTVDTWLLYHLTNKKTYATDVTNASRTMLFDINKKKYDEDLCKQFNIPIEQLPDVLNSDDLFGFYSIENHKIPITGVIGDQQAALYAQCGRQTNLIKNTYGTGLFLMANTGQDVSQSTDLLTTIAIGIDGAVDYAIEGSVFTGGSLIQWLRDNLKILESTDASEELAKSVPNSAGVTIVPALSGLGAPYWLPNATALITGLTHKTTQAHIVRAALEAIGLQTNDLVNVIKKQYPNIAFNDLLVDGGASQNNWLMQLQANLCQLTVRRPRHIEATALGAALVANHHTGFFKRMNKEDTQFTPHKEPIELINQWRAAIQLIKTS